MEVSGQHYDPAALPAGKNPVRLEKKRLGEPQSRSGRSGGENNLLVLSQIEPRIVQTTVYSLYHPNVYYHTLFQDLKVCGASAVSSSQLRVPAMLILTAGRCWGVLQRHNVHTKFQGTSA